MSLGLVNLPFPAVPTLGASRILIHIIVYECHDLPFNALSAHGFLNVFRRPLFRRVPIIADCIDIIYRFDFVSP